MKIGLIGSHGVGKTTLCFDVAARLKRLDLGVELVKEVARACPLPINRETTAEAQGWILHTQIAEEIVAAARYDIVVSDRTVLDNYAYMVHKIGHHQAYVALVRTWMSTYDNLFRVPIVDAPSFDGIRDTSSTFQREIDDLISELLVTFDVSCYALDPADREGWAETVVRETGLPTMPAQLDIFTSPARPVGDATA
jgi:hypothetical protein